MSLWDYLSYSRANPVLSIVSEAGRRTGVQDVSKKGLTIASQAGTGFRQTLGYGEKYNITQEQAGEIGYIAGSLVTPGAMITKAGLEVAKVSRTGGSIPGLLTIPGKIGTTKKGATILSKLPSLTTVAKVGVGAAGVGLLYQGYKAGERGLSTLWPDPNKPTKKDQNGGGNGWPPPTDGWPPPTITPGGDVIFPPYPPRDVLWGGPGEDFLQKLGNLFSAPGIGLGSGIQAIGAGTGASIVPLAIVAGAVVLGSKYMGKGKRKGKKK